MFANQRTIQKEIELSGVGLHTGNPVKMRLKPAAEDSGIRFVRVDLPGSPVIQAGPQNIVLEPRLPRCTSLGRGEAVVHTVEHLMSVLFGLGISNIIVEMNNNELPGLDGCGQEFLRAVRKAGIVDQSRPREFIEVREPISVFGKDSSMLIVPDKDFKVSYTLDYDHPHLKSQFFHAVVEEKFFEEEIAPCRTFCLEEETAELRARNLGQGANFVNTLVVGKNGVIDNKVRFPNEFARHKVLDLIGDLYLLGKPIRGHVFAAKSGHTLNVALLHKISTQLEERRKSGFTAECSLGDKKVLDVKDIMCILPHRYPFLLVDRVIDLERGKRAVGIKNVTINDNFFEGHFPTRPIMPGVLMVEAMAQLGGIIVLTNEEHRGKLALFLGADKIKFRKMVVPGDQLVLEVEVIRDRSKTALLQGQAKVNGEVVAEAEVMVSFTDNTFLN